MPNHNKSTPNITNEHILGHIKNTFNKQGEYVQYTFNGLTHRRPTTVNGSTLYYICQPQRGSNTLPTYRPKCAIIQLWLYRWFMSLAKQQPLVTQILKNDLADLVYKDHPTFSKHHIAQTMHYAVPYHLSYQQRLSGQPSRQYYRWYHPLEIAYGLEYVMLAWLPFITRTCDTQESYMEELEMILEQNKHDDIQLIGELAENYQHLKENLKGKL